MSGPVLELVLAGVAVLLLVSIGLGMVRVWMGPSLADRMLAAQLFGTAGVALLLVLGELQGLPWMRNAALILSLLAVMSVVAFVSRVWRADRQVTRSHTGESARDAAK